MGVVVAGSHEDLNMRSEVSRKDSNSAEKKIPRLLIEGFSFEEKMLFGNRKYMNQHSFY